MSLRRLSIVVAATLARGIPGFRRGPPRHSHPRRRRGLLRNNGTIRLRDLEFWRRARIRAVLQATFTGTGGTVVRRRISIGVRRLKR